LSTSDFDYPLPVELIAQHPPDKRSGGRLLCLDDQLMHKRIEDLPELLRQGDLLVMNNTRVFPARLFGKKITGGRVELLVEKIIDDCVALCLCKSSKSPKPETQLELDSGHTATVEGREDDLFIVRFNLQVPLLEHMQEYGTLPLPPYIERSADAADIDRYQTVFASNTGAIAAPTAGLHFDAELLARCKAVGVETGFVTLHVGAGTFQPVRTDNMTEHKMHAEWLCVDQQVCDQINATKKRGGRVVAIGTTVVRSLETAAQSGELKPFKGDTRLFIKPGDRFNVIDGLLTNFHLPKSTLLMLVCAFGGMQRVMRSYKAAVESEYRFFSYGDAMLLWPCDNPQESTSKES